MGYTIKQKIEICLKAESDPNMTQQDLAMWAKDKYGSSRPPSQTTISRILSAKNDLIASKETEFLLVRRRKKLNPILRRILTEWITQALWENIPITTPIIQQTAHSIWNRLPNEDKMGNGLFNQKWCNQFIKKLNVNITGDESDFLQNPGNYPLNKVWKLDEKLELKNYLVELIRKENYRPQDIFFIDEFQLFYSLPLDQIFDVSSIDKGLQQSNSSTEDSLTVMIGTNVDGSEKLRPLIVGKYERFDLSASTIPAFKNFMSTSSSKQNLMNKVTEVCNIYYKSNINKWITSSMFQNYILTLDHKLANSASSRKILILLDDSASHRIINLKLNNIRLCYLKNNTNHKNPYNSFNGVKVDYLPSNFGIMKEIKIFYRLQQYLEMISLQRKNSNDSGSNGFSSSMNVPGHVRKVSLLAFDVLLETDYKIPLIKAIEWIKRSWEAVTPETIFLAWRKSYLINLKNEWPSSDMKINQNAKADLSRLFESSKTFNPSKSYDRLSQVMGHFNVVIPWNIDDLLGLVNERGKITLSYVSIEEMIGSCLAEPMEGQDSGVAKNYTLNLISNDIEGDGDADWIKENNFADQDRIFDKSFVSSSSSILNFTNGVDDASDLLALHYPDFNSQISSVSSSAAQVSNSKAFGQILNDQNVPGVGAGISPFSNINESNVDSNTTLGSKRPCVADIPKLGVVDGFSAVPLELSGSSGASNATVMNAGLSYSNNDVSNRLPGKPMDSAFNSIANTLQGDSDFELIQILKTLLSATQMNNKLNFTKNTVLELAENLKHLLAKYKKDCEMYSVSPIRK